MKRLNIYMVAHTQELILDKYCKYPPFIFVMVGETPDFRKLINANERGESLKYTVPTHYFRNIEQFKSLLTFTAWYHLAYNTATFFKGTDYVGILEYDVEIKKDIYELLQFCEPDTIICFESKPTLHPIFLQDVQGLYDSIEKVYGHSLKYFEQLMLHNNDNTWGPTSNCVMPKQFLFDFVQWYKKLIPEILKYPNHPHFHERAIKLFCILKNYTVLYKPEYLVHQQANSHNYQLKNN